ncbi:MAG: TylF/MycF family methyltransferase [Bacteroidota bacterium]|nr:TylF/MycF family methyltransferase [Bacteroidota bacterium]
MDFNSKIAGNSSLSNASLKVQNYLNLLLNKFGLKAEIARYHKNGADMVTLYQKMNLFHMVNNVIDTNIEGDMLEMGCYDGRTATLIQTIIESKNSEKKLYLFDNFKHDFGSKRDTKQDLFKNFKLSNLKDPLIHEGFFSATIPDKLPSKISFMHIDCGYGGDPVEHKNNILHILNNTYDRLTPGSITIFMDYHEKGVTLDGWDANPGVKMACDEFFAGKPEKVHVLFGGHYSHGYFKKQLF